jgi:SAM-dependent methyltransferase
MRLRVEVACSPLRCPKKERQLHARAFDELAAEYDTAFTESAIGRTLRALVWLRLEQAFKAPTRVLELGCGTGEDALSLARRGVDVVAVDASERMIQIARRKAQETDRHSGAGDRDRAPRNHGERPNRSEVATARAEFHCLPMQNLASAFDGQSFDGVLSNFGAINCVPDLPALVADVAARLRPGAPLVWVVMGRHVPWEWLWYLGRGNWTKAWRRLNRGGVRWRGLNILYPTPSELTKLLRPHFAIRRIAPLGVALPPSYAGAWLDRHPYLLKVLTRLEHLAQRWSVLASLSDHYIVEATRLPAEEIIVKASGVGR